MSGGDLNLKILEAHERGEGCRLAKLYFVAAEDYLKSGQTDAGCFFLTQSYVFALENGLALAETVRNRLVGLGRER